MQIGFGTAAIGRPQYINIRPDSKKGSFDREGFRQNGIDMLDHAYASGVRYFDTAPGYGMAEDLLIDWMNKRTDLEISAGTKWGYTYVADFNPAAEVHEIKEHSISKLKEQWNKSKSLLPHLKYYQVHSATMESGVLDNERVLREMQRLKENFNVKIGITTSGANQIAVLKYALEVNERWGNLFDVFQVTFNMLDQSLIKVKELRIPIDSTIIIKEALANGRIFRNDRYPHYNDLYITLEDMASRYQVGVDAIALRFAMQSFPNSIVLSGASTQEQLSQNLKARQIILSEEDLAAIQNHGIVPSVYWDERKKLNWN